MPKQPKIIYQNSIENGSIFIEVRTLGQVELTAITKKVQQQFFVDITYDVGSNVHAVHGSQANVINREYWSKSIEELKIKLCKEINQSSKSAIEKTSQSVKPKQYKPISFSHGIETYIYNHKKILIDLELDQDTEKWLIDFSESEGFKDWLKDKMKEDILLKNRSNMAN
jgi:hypothetical protein